MTVYLFRLLIGSFLLVNLAIPSTLWATSDAHLCQAGIDNQLKNLLKAADGARLSFVNRSEAQIQTSLDEIIANVDCSYKLSRGMKVHERKHLLSMLFGIREMARQTKKSSGESREVKAQEVFRQLAHMSQIYNITGAYRIYFCGTDRSFWLQSGGQPTNPVHPDTLKSCGVRIPASQVSTHAE